MERDKCANNTKVVEGKGDGRGLLIAFLRSGKSNTNSLDLYRIEIS